MNTDPVRMPQPRAFTALFAAAAELNRGALNSAFLFFSAIMAILLSSGLVNETVVSHIANGSLRVANVSSNDARMLGVFALVAFFISAFSLYTIVIDCAARSERIERSYLENIRRSALRFAPTLAFTIAAVVIFSAICAALSLILTAIEPHTILAVALSLAVAGFLALFILLSMLQSILAIGTADILVREASIGLAARHAFALVANRRGVLRALGFTLSNVLFSAIPIVVVQYVFAIIIAGLQTEFAKFLLALLMLGIFIWIYLLIISAQTIYGLESLATLSEANAKPEATPQNSASL